MYCPKRCLACVALLLSVPVAQASVLPRYQAFGDLAFNFSPPQRLFPSDFGSFTLADPRFGVVSVTASGTPVPSLTADSSIGPNVSPSIFGRGNMSLFYSLEILGPAGAVPVLIGAAGVAQGFANSGASFAVESFWQVRDAGTVLIGDDIRSGQIDGGSFSQSFGHTVGITLATNHVYEIAMLADAAAAATLEGSRASAHASVDPFFSFDLGVDPSVFSFHLSDGIGNVAATAVPEPSTFMLLASALLVLGLWRRASTQPRACERSPRAATAGLPPCAPTRARARPPRA
jgi:PEP-CTERM motif